VRRYKFQFKIPSMHKKAFTLIETLIALSIVVVVLGASISANRVIQISSQVTAERTQMSALVDESVSSLQLFQRQIATATLSLGGPTGFDIIGGVGNSPVKKVIFYSDPSVSYVSAITQKICSDTTAACQVEKSPVHIGVAALTVAQMFANNSIAGELVAVRRSPAALRQGLSMSSRLTTDGNGIADVTATADLGIWDFYVRQINVIRLGSAGSWYGQTLNAGHTQGQARNATYQVTISISKYQTASTPTVSRTIILTDN
jgi:prepilin-type N-terminal cleavage/methylation domain-containing protein